MNFAHARRCGDIAAAMFFMGWVGISPVHAEPAKQADKELQRFDVQEYRVLGNTVLTGRDIERVLYPLLGPNKSLSDVEGAKTALETFYHDHGYGTVFVDIPPQKVEEGIVRLRVTEGRIEKEEIAGARYFPERDVITALPAAAAGGVLQISKLQEQLATVNAATADRSVVPVLKAGSEAGTVDLSLQVNDSLPLHGSLELNNQATIDTRPLRSVASLSYGDMFGRFDTLSFQYQASPQQFDQVRVIAVNYLSHVLDSGLQPSVSYINSNTNVATVGALGVLGIGEIFGARLAYVIPSAASTSQSLTVGLDYKHFRNTINEDATTSLDTPISYLDISLAYAGLWRSDWLMTAVSASANAGPRGLVNGPDEFANDRYKGRANYFYVRGDLAFNIKLPDEFSLRLRAAGQGASEPLIANENFTVGGVDGVRGYLESEELGDKAIKGTLQLNSPAWHFHERVIGDLYLFFDAGRTWVIDSLADEPSGATLRSWGGGFDLFPSQKLTGSFTWAKALLAGTSTTAGSSRVLFVLRDSF